MEKIEPSYQLIRLPKAAEAFVDSLSSAASFALDLEADSLHSYQEKVCLAQFTTPAGNFILDPLECRDAFAGLGPVLATSSVQKVVHGADYDVRLLKKDYGFSVSNLFDTMIAAQLVGREQVGLAALLAEFFDVELDKKYQRADWSLRPLPPELLSYAALDTAYLFPLKERLETELRDLGRLSWAREEFELLAAVTPAPPKAPWCLDVKGASRLSPRELAVLQALLELRDEVARERNRPAFKVVGNDVLVKWAQSPPTTRRDVLDTPGVPKPVLDRLEPRILEAVKTGRGLPLEDCPRLPDKRYVPMTGSQERRLKRLKAVRQAASERHRLSPGLLVNSATLERLARMEPGDAASSVPTVLKRWQGEALGSALIEVFS